jgi:hemin uptake protein HemP
MSQAPGSEAGAANARGPESDDAASPLGARRVVTSDALFGGESQLAIVHERTVYFLRRTRLGKLILTK